MAASSFETKSLAAALIHIETIERKINATNGALNKTVFSSNAPLTEDLDNARLAIALEFQFLIKHIRAVKPSHPMAVAFPTIHYHIQHGIACWNWLVYEYGTPLSVDLKWQDVAISIFDDVSIMKIAVESALKADGYT